MTTIFDTLSQTKKAVKKPERGKLKLFVCGPTVYDYSHIGHARTYVVFDAFVKYLRLSGFGVFYLQNITDVDDKIINRARERKTSPMAWARKFEKEYLKDIKNLEINSVNKYARASGNIKEIQKQISTLIKKGFAYQTKNGIYLEVKKFQDYGKLSKQNLEELRSGYRIEPDPEKKDPLDFGLWKFRPGSTVLPKKPSFKIINGEPTWSSPWGWGRPGWHIEDTAITEKYFGPQYDIHGGGNDLKFPHHEAEIAQQEAASGKKPLVKIWMHTGFLLVNGEKMSKSLNNFITIRDFLKRHSAKVLRIMIFANHYRSPFNYSEQSAEQAKNSLKTIEDFIGKLEFIAKSKVKNKNSGLQKEIEYFNESFWETLNDDFNTPKAMAEIFNFISLVQKNIWQLSSKEAKNILKTVQDKLKIFELAIKTPKIPAKIAVLAEKREIYRRNKQFTHADALRSKAEVLGYLIEDTPLGPMAVKKS